jgi:GNAT superfamily N-acetyltransferase
MTLPTTGKVMEGEERSAELASPRSAGSPSEESFGGGALVLPPLREGAGIAGSPRLVRARAGDHPAIHQFLVSVFHGPSAAEFHAQQDEPLYEPTDRLLVKRGERTLAHVHLTKRVLRYGSLEIPAAGVAHLGTLPEFRRQGLATALLSAAERQMADDGAVLGVVRTVAPQFYLRRGWAVCGRHCYSVCNGRDLLSHLQATRAIEPTLLGPRPPPLNIRLWRHVEQAALMRLYAHNTAGTFGPHARSEDYWRWLISRKAYDRIYVAISGPDNLGLEQANAQIVGYAVMKEGRIVELMTDPSSPEAASQLLGRAGADAIEHDRHTLRLDAPPGHALHGFFKEAGGTNHHHEADHGEVLLARVFEPIQFLWMLCGDLHVRARSAQLVRPCELGLNVEGEKHRLVLSRRSVKVESGKLGRSYLACGRAELTQLLLGHLDVDKAAAKGQLECSTRVAIETARVLFPQLPTWRPPWDDLPA